ncbi:hypothetical protein G7Y89_g14698 [Cudoniella acicularis]|uniref:Amino acid transporter transmembrane domain-containing protein n=1 Tax=Cudoniella acicularis TaxID=354080 RepID=A0A8H4R0F2_9HELO|nr:hypothetical protein G7Y89_g14698 [Cudoniella acicularis]
MAGQSIIDGWMEDVYEQGTLACDSVAESPLEENEVAHRREKRQETSADEGTDRGRKRWKTTPLLEKDTTDLPRSRSPARALRSNSRTKPLQEKSAYTASLNNASTASAIKLTSATTLSQSSTHSESKSRSRVRSRSPAKTVHDLENADPPTRYLQMQHPDNQIPPSQLLIPHLDEFDAEDDELFDNVADDNAEETFREILRIQTKARRCFESDKPEASWGEEVVRPLLDLATLRVDGRAVVENVTSTNILPPTLIPRGSGSEGLPYEEKRVDYCIFLEPTKEEAQSIKSRLKKLPDGEVWSINQTAAFYLREKPLLSSIELKKSRSNHDPLLQLAIWNSALFQKLEDLLNIAGSSNSMLPVPSVTVSGHNWQVYYSYIEEDGRSRNTLRDGDEVNWIITHKDVEDIKESWFQPGDMNAVRELVQDCDPRMKAVMEKTKECLDWKICYRDPIPTWVSNSHKIALLGDSRHPHLPTSAQGASQATESAAVLALCLKLAGKDNVPLATRVYEKLRFARVRLSQLNSEELRDRWHNALKDLDRNIEINPEDVKIKGIYKFNQTKQEKPLLNTVTCKALDSAHVAQVRSDPKFLYQTLHPSPPSTQKSLQQQTLLQRLRGHDCNQSTAIFSGLLASGPDPKASGSLQSSDKQTTFTPDSHSENPKYDLDIVGQTTLLEAQGNAHFKRLGWKRLTVVLLVEAIALGTLSIPGAFATLGMVAGVITTVGMGLIAIYTSYVVGQVKLAFPHVAHYADAGRLMMGRFGYELIGAMFALELIFLVGSHCLTGAIAFGNLTSDGACSLVFAVVSAIILLFLAIPPSFADVAILGYIDFVSIMLAIGITMVATGVASGKEIGGVAAVNWSAWPKEDVTFVEAFIAITNIVFAYSFAVCQFSFMDEMHTTTDYVKSIWALGLIEIFIYTLTGAIIYALVGQDVSSPALLSAGTLMSKVAFGIALPVIFVSGSINGTVVARYIHGRMYKDSVVRFINTKKGWITWLALITFITIIAWVIAEAIPFFSDLLSICSALFISGFTFYFPAIMWFMLIKKGKWYEKKNLFLSVVNAFIFVIGIIVLVAGTYSAIVDIMDQYKKGTVRGAFTCAPLS